MAMRPICKNCASRVDRLCKIKNVYVARKLPACKEFKAK